MRWDLLVRLVSKVKHRSIQSSGRHTHLDPLSSSTFHYADARTEQRGGGWGPHPPAGGGDAIAAAPGTGPRRISCLRSPSIPGNDLSRGQEGRALRRRQPQSPVSSAATLGPSEPSCARARAPHPRPLRAPCARALL